MAEQDPTIRARLSIEFTTTPEGMIKTIQHLGELAVKPLRVGIEVDGEQLSLFELDFTPDSGQRVVTKGTFVHSYLRSGMADASPSSLPAYVYNEVLKAIPSEGHITDEKGEVTGIRREAFDEFLDQRQKGKIQAVTGPKKTRLLNLVAQSLPDAVEDEEL